MSVEKLIAIGVASIQHVGESGLERRPSIQITMILKPHVILQPTVPHPPPKSFKRYAILDSGATRSFVTTEDQRALTNLVTTNDGPTIIAANGNPMPTQA